MDTLPGDSAAPTAPQGSPPSPTGDEGGAGARPGMEAHRQPPALALDFRPERVSLWVRRPDGWEEAASADTAGKGFAARAAALEAEADRRGLSRRPALLWLPEDQVLVRAAAPGDTLPATRREAALWLAETTGHARDRLADMLVIAPPAPAPDGRWAVMGAPRETWREARAYAAAWGFVPGPVSTRHGADLFDSGGPVFEPLGPAAEAAISAAAAGPPPRREGAVGEAEGAATRETSRSALFARAALALGLAAIAAAALWVGLAGPKRGGDADGRPGAIALSGGSAEARRLGLSGRSSETRASHRGIAAAGPHAVRPPPDPDAPPALPEGLAAGSRPQSADGLIAPPPATPPEASAVASSRPEAPEPPRQNPGAPAPEIAEPRAEGDAPQIDRPPLGRVARLSPALPALGPPPSRRPDLDGLRQRRSVNPPERLRLPTLRGPRRGPDTAPMAAPPQMRAPGRPRPPALAPSVGGSRRAGLGPAPPVPEGPLRPAAARPVAGLYGMADPGEALGRTRLPEPVEALGPRPGMSQPLALAPGTASGAAPAHPSVRPSQPASAAPKAVPLPPVQERGRAPDPAPDPAAEAGPDVPLPPPRPPSGLPLADASQPAPDPGEEPTADLAAPEAAVDGQKEAGPAIAAAPTETAVAVPMVVPAPRPAALAPTAPAPSGGAPLPRVVALVEPSKGTERDAVPADPEPAQEAERTARLSPVFKAPPPPARPEARAVGRSAGREAAGLPPIGRVLRPTGRSVSLAARDRGLPLDRPTLIGILQLDGGRAALLRLPDGKVRRVARGDALDGWTVELIGRDAMRLARGGRSRTLLLVGR